MLDTISLIMTAPATSTPSLPIYAPSSLVDNGSWEHTPQYCTSVATCILNDRNLLFNGGFEDVTKYCSTIGSCSTGYANIAPWYTTGIGAGTSELAGENFTFNLLIILRNLWWSSCSKYRSLFYRHEVTDLLNFLIIFSASVAYTINQDLTLVPSATYTLSFAIHPNTVCGPVAKTGFVGATGVVPMFVPTNSSVFSGWQILNYTFVAVCKYCAFVI